MPLYLPPEDRLYLTKINIDEEEPDTTKLTLPVEDEVDPPTHPSTRIVSRRVSTKQSPHFKQGLLQTTPIDDHAGHRC